MRPKIFILVTVAFLALTVPALAEDVPFDDSDYLPDALVQASSQTLDNTAAFRFTLPAEDETGEVKPPTGKNVMVVFNAAYKDDDNGNRLKDGLEIALHYAKERKIPLRNLCRIRTATEETIDRAQFDEMYDPDGLYRTHIKQQVERCLERPRLKDDIRYIVLTKGVPLRISALYSSAYNQADYSSVDSALLFVFQDVDITWRQLSLYAGSDYKFELISRFMPNTYRAGAYNISYLVTRLDGYTVDDVRGMIDRAVEAKMDSDAAWVFDDISSGPGAICDSMLYASNLIGERGFENVFYDDTNSALLTPEDVGNNSVIGYSSHGVYEPGLGGNALWSGKVTFDIAPGAIYNSWESYNGISFDDPDATSHNTVADWIHIGGSGGIGNTFEPWCSGIAVDYRFFTAYAAGYPFADAAYLSLSYLDFTSVVAGDPLMTLEEKEPRRNKHPRRRRD